MLCPLGSLRDSVAAAWSLSLTTFCTLNLSRQRHIFTPIYELCMNCFARTVDLSNGWRCGVCEELLVADCLDGSFRCEERFAAARQEVERRRAAATAAVVPSTTAPPKKFRVKKQG